MQHQLIIEVITTIMVITWIIKEDVATAVTVAVKVVTKCSAKCVLSLDTLPQLVTTGSILLMSLHLLIISMRQAPLPLCLMLLYHTRTFHLLCILEPQCLKQPRCLSQHLHCGLCTMLLLTVCKEHNLLLLYKELSNLWLTFLKPCLLELDPIRLRYGILTLVLHIIWPPMLNTFNSLFPSKA